MIRTIVTAILGLILKRKDAVLIEIVVGLIEAAIELVRVLSARDIPGPDKMAQAIAVGGEFADEVLSLIPLWANYPQDRRNVIVEGFAELVRFWLVADKQGDLQAVKPRAIRKAARRASKALAFKVSG